MAPSTLARLVGVEQAEVAPRRSPTSARRSISAFARSSCTGVRASDDRAALAEVAVDALRRRDAHRPRRRCRTSRAAGAIAASRATTRAPPCVQRGREQRRRPAAVAAARAEARRLATRARRSRSDGVGLREVVRRPEPGVARADDGDVRRRSIPGSGGRGGRRPGRRAACPTTARGRRYWSCVLIGSRSPRSRARGTPHRARRARASPNTSRIGTTPPHTGRSRSCGSSSGCSSLIFTLASSSGRASTSVAASSLRDGGRMSSQRPGSRWSEMIRRARSRSSPSSTVHVPSTIAPR